MASPHKHLKRYRQIAGVLADEGLGTVLDVTGLRRFARLRSRILGRTRTRVSDMAGIEARVRRTLERLGPTAVKLGQLMSSRADLLPESLVLELRKLQDEVPPVSFDRIRPVLERELGGPVSEFFAEFDETPLAAASIGQVHRAVLPDGTAVAVKVQRPDIEDMVEVDLDVLLTQSRFVERHTEWGRRYHPSDIADEMARALRTELDYLTEARNAERFREAFAGDPSVAFPEIHWEVTTRRVLTMELFEGIPLNELDRVMEAGLDRKALARAGIDCYFEQIFGLGYYHADPHPGNLFALPDGTVAFTDFGRVGSISFTGKEQLSDLFLAVLHQDERLAADVLIDVSGASWETDVTRLEREVGRLISKYYDAALGDIRMRDLLLEMSRMMREHGLWIRSEFALLLSTFATLESVGSELDPTLDFVEAARPHASRITAQRMHPDNLVRHAGRTLRTLTRLAGDLPESLRRSLKRAGEGEFGMSVRPTGFQPLMEQLDELVSRLSFTILIAAYVIGLSFIIRQAPLPDWALVIAQIGLLAAAGVGAWLFMAMLLSHYRSRRRR